MLNFWRRMLLLRSCSSGPGESKADLSRKAYDLLDLFPPSTRLPHLVPPEPKVSIVALGQGWQILLLDGRLPAEFSFNLTVWPF